MSLKDYPVQEGRSGYVVLNRRQVKHLMDIQESEYLLIRDCPLCGGESRAIVPAQGLWDWEHGKFVQEAFPNLGAEEREQVMTGIHGPCYDRMAADVEGCPDGCGDTVAYDEVQEIEICQHCGWRP